MISKIEDIYERSQFFWANHRARRLFRIGLILIWLLLIGTAAWLGWKNQAVISQYFVNARPEQLFTSFAYYLLALGCAAASWMAIAYPFSKDVSWQQHLHIYLLTLASRRLPGTVWYIGGRAVMYKKIGVSTSSITLASGIELITSSLIGLCFGLVWIAAQGKISILAVTATVGGLIILGLTLGTITYRMTKSTSSIQQKPGPMLWLLSILIVVLMSGTWLFGGLMAANMVQVFQPLSGEEILRVVAFWALSGGLGLITFFLPSSFGVTELTFAGLLLQLTPLPVATSIAVLTRVATTIFEVLLAGLIFFGRKIRIIQKVESD